MELMNSAMAAKYLKISTRTLQRLRDTGRIRYYQDSRLIRYFEKDLVDYMTQNVMEPFERRKEVKNG